VRLVRRFFGMLFAVVIPILAVALLIAVFVSPRFVQLVAKLDGETHAVSAQSLGCSLVREGQRWRDAVSCRFAYAWEGRAHEADVVVWYSDNPWATLAGLERALARESVTGTHTLHVNPRFPDRPTSPDARWVSVPPLWLSLALIWLALLALVTCYGSGVRAHRREDYRLDPVTDRLVPVPGRHQPRAWRDGVLICTFAGVTFYACAFGVSNRVSNASIMLGMGGLKRTPATLTDCQSRYVGQRRGVHHIECAVQYQAAGATQVGQAEALEFRWLPTEERRERRIQSLEGTAVTAYVHPDRPTYARAFLSEDWFLPFTWGIFTLMQWLCLLVAVPCLVVWGLSRLRPLP